MILVQGLFVQRQDPWKRILNNGDEDKIVSATTSVLPGTLRSALMPYSLELQHVFRLERGEQLPQGGAVIQTAHAQSLRAKNRGGVSFVKVF